MSVATLQRIPTMVLGGLAGLGVVLVTLAPQALAADTTVSMTDNAFGPATITINVGDTVTWVNNGEHDHTATADDRSWDSGELAPGGSFSHTFTTAGTFGYFCELHGAPGGIGMSGTIVVQAAAPSEPTPAPTAQTVVVQPTAAAAAAPGTPTVPVAGVPNAAMDRPSPVGMVGVALLVAAALVFGIANLQPLKAPRRAR